MRPAGCGGRWLREAIVGDKVLVRYAVLEDGGKVLDGGGEGFVVTVGSGDVGLGVFGVCEGMLREMRVMWRGVGRVAVLVYAEKVFRGGWMEGDGDGEGGVDWEGRVVGVGGRRGWSCERVCRDWGGVCEEKGFVVVNTCPRLRRVFDCKVCEVAAVGSAGADMPCWVHWSAPRGHPRGYCLVHPHKGRSRCGARYRHTVRLCPCAKEEVG